MGAGMRLDGARVRHSVTGIGMPRLCEGGDSGALAVIICPSPGPRKPHDYRIYNL